MVLRCEIQRILDWYFGRLLFSWIPSYQIHHIESQEQNGNQSLVYDNPSVFLETRLTW
jgi:hypothetical protein